MIKNTMMIENIKKIVSDNNYAFNGWRSSYKHLTGMINERNYKFGAEVGVAFGDHCDYILEHTDVKILYGIDPYMLYDDYKNDWDRQHFSVEIENRDQKYFDYLYEYVLEKLLTKYGGRVEIVRKKSEEAVKIFGKETLDFVYIDGNHSDEYIKKDLEDWWNTIRIGGIIAGHDYNHPGLPDVTKRVDIFAKDKNLDTIYLGDHVWFIEKKK